MTSKLAARVTTHALAMANVDKTCQPGLGEKPEEDERGELTKAILSNPKRGASTSLESEAVPSANKPEPNRRSCWIRRQAKKQRRAIGGNEKEVGGH